jgi:OmpA-OmpF porin, OOP family
MRNMVRGLMLVAGCWAAQAGAVSSDERNLPYVGAQYLLEFADSARNSDDGDGFQLSLGLPIGWPNSAIELTLSDVGRDRFIDGKNDYQTALMVDWVYDFGSFGWDSGIAFKPFVLAGIGAVQEDVRGSKHTHLGANLGAGLLFPTGFHGLAVRTEARWLGHDNGGKSVSGENLLEDFHVSLGLQLPLWFLAEDDSAPAPVDDCGVRVVGGTATTRDDCGPDSDRDGVVDSADRCPGTPSGTLVNARGCPMTDGFVLRGVNFPFDSATLDDAAMQVLDDVAATLASKSNQNLQVQIGGHTDVVGSEAYNIMLSQQRAEAVRQYLVGRGVAAERLTAEGFGTSQPIASNDSEEGRAQNRRVEFKIRAE